APRRSRRRRRWLFYPRCVRPAPCPEERSPGGTACRRQTAARPRRARRDRRDSPGFGSFGQRSRPFILARKQTLGKIEPLLHFVQLLAQVCDFTLQVAGFLIVCCGTSAAPPQPLGEGTAEWTTEDCHH